MRRLSRSPPSTLHTHMLRSEPEFDPSSKEINILGRRDAIVAIVASLLSVVVITVGLLVIDLHGTIRVCIF